MNLLFKDDLSHDNKFAIVMLINSVPECDFNDFILSIIEKKDWVENLCSCYFNAHIPQSYSFETDDGSEILVDYESVLKYLKLAIIRYLQGCRNEANRIETEQMLKYTTLSSVLNLLDKTPRSGIPLIFD